jgi:hypothetical protein
MLSPVENAGRFKGLPFAVKVIYTDFCHFELLAEEDRGEPDRRRSTFEP